jgi:K+ transporter
VENTTVLAVLNPITLRRFSRPRAGPGSFRELCFFALTGAELYADMRHFGRRAIRHNGDLLRLECDAPEKADGQEGTPHNHRHWGA